MNIALIGYGRMGHEIEEAARRRAHSISAIIDAANKQDLNVGTLKGTDAAIVFTVPDAAFENVAACLRLGIPVVSGTTGWDDKYEDAVKICKENNTSFIHSSNFSLGVNLLFQLNRKLAEYMNRFEDYSVSIEEIHHIRKLDSPSGTAITLADGITKHHSRYEGWTLAQESAYNKVGIISLREGEVPGTHSITWNSAIDSLTLRHEARNRQGFAVGAVMAAEYIATRKGVFTINEVLGF